MSTPTRNKRHSVLAFTELGRLFIKPHAKRPSSSSSSTPNASEPPSTPIHSSIKQKFTGNSNTTSTTNNNNNSNQQKSEATSTTTTTTTQEETLKQQQNALSNAVSSGDILPSAYLIGHEQSLAFLVARDDLFLNRTCIELVRVTSPNVIMRRVLYVHERIVKVVSASLNHDSTILAYTVFVKKQQQQQQTETGNNSSSDGSGGSSGDLDEKQEKSLGGSQRRSSSSSSKSSSSVGFYESYLIEVEKSNRYLFDVRGTQLQRIQFIHDQNRRGTSFLFMRDKERIELYHVMTEKIRKVTRIRNQPEFQATFVKSHLWMQWDPEGSLLYYMVRVKPDSSRPSNNSNNNSNAAHYPSTNTTNNNGNNSSFSGSANQHGNGGVSSPRAGSSSNRLNASKIVNDGHQTVECAIRCCNFSDANRPHMLFDYVLPISISSELLSGSSHIDRFPWRNGNCSPDSSVFFQIVKVENGLCLCQQHVQNPTTVAIENKETKEKESPTPGFTIKISIYVLHHRTKIDYTIPAEQLAHIDPSIRKYVRAFFGLMDNMLVVYVPGAHLQLLDVCSNHKPVPLIQFTRADVPHLPFYTGGVEMAISIQSGKLDTTDTTDVLLNLRKGVVYSYRLSLASLERWCFVPRAPQESVALVHILIHHLKNVGLLEQLMKTFCSYKYRKSLAAIIEEYLTGMAFDLYSQQSATDKEFLKLVPLSSLERSSPSDFPDFAIQSLGSYYDYGNNVMGKTIRSPHKHCTSFILRNLIVSKLLASDPFQSQSTGTTSNNSSSNNIVAVGKNSSSDLPTKSSFKTSFFSFFMRSVDEGKPILPDVPLMDDTYGQQSRTMFVETLLDILSAGTRDVKQKQRIFKSLSEYVTILTKQTNHLWTNVRKDEYTLQYFRVIESFATALDESCFPVPNEFTTHFSIVAYQSLARSAFLQYVSRGIVKISEDVLRHISRDLFTESTENSAPAHRFTEQQSQSFFASLLQDVHDNELRLSYYEKLLTQSPLMMDHYHQSLAVNASSFDMLLESYNQLMNSQQNGQQHLTDGTEMIDSGINTSFAPLTIYLLSLNSERSQPLANTITSQPLNIASPPSSDSSNTPSHSFFSFMTPSTASRDSGYPDLDNIFAESDSASEDILTYEDHYTRYILQHSEQVLHDFTLE